MLPKPKDTKSDPRNYLSLSQNIPSNIIPNTTITSVVPGSSDMAFEQHETPTDTVIVNASCHGHFIVRGGMVNSIPFKDAFPMNLFGKIILVDLTVSFPGTASFQDDQTTAEFFDFFEDLFQKFETRQYTFDKYITEVNQGLYNSSKKYITNTLTQILKKMLFNAKKKIEKLWTKLITSIMTKKFTEFDKLITQFNLQCEEFIDCINIASVFISGRYNESVKFLVFKNYKPNQNFSIVEKMYSSNNELLKSHIETINKDNGELEINPSLWNIKLFNTNNDETTYAFPFGEPFNDEMSIIPPQSSKTYEISNLDIIRYTLSSFTKNDIDINTKKTLIYLNDITCSHLRTFGNYIGRDLYALADIVDIASATPSSDDQTNAVKLRPSQIMQLNEYAKSLLLNDPELLNLLQESIVFFESMRKQYYDNIDQIKMPRDDERKRIMKTYLNALFKESNLITALFEGSKELSRKIAEQPVFIRPTFFKAPQQQQQQLQDVSPIKSTENFGGSKKRKNLKKMTLKKRISVNMKKTRNKQMKRLKKGIKTKKRFL